MDTAPTSISVSDLMALVGTARAPLVIDVRRAQAFDGRLIAGALRRLPEQVTEWGPSLPTGERIVTTCVHGHEVSRNVAAALRAQGRDALYLEDGVEGWRARAGPGVTVITALGVPGERPSRWVTRERPKIDRIACPWLVRRFIDPLAEFLYVPANEVLGAAQREHAVPYDVSGVRFTHRGEHCSFDALLEDFALREPALDRLAVIVRGADTGRPDLAPQAAGLLAISQGLSANFADDHAMLAKGMDMYDALYSWARLQ